MSAPASRAIAPGVLAPRLPVVGRIQIGEKGPAIKSKSGNTFQPPTKLDYFRIAKLTRGNDGNFETDEAIHAKLGVKPVALDIRLPFDTRGENLYTRMLHYAGRTRARECDGDRFVDPRTQVGGVCDLAQGKPCDCKPYARLAVILEAGTTFGGVHVYRTTSWVATAGMLGTLRMLEQELGSLRGLPMQMQLHPGEVRWVDNGKEKTGTAYRVALVLRASYEEAREAMLEFHRSNRIARREVLALASGTVADLDELDAEEEPDIGDEFFPPRLSAGEPEPAPNKLAQINEAIVGGPGTEEDEGQPDAADLVARMRALIEQAPRAGLALNDTHMASLDAAMESGEIGHLRTGIDWLETQTAKKQAALAEGDA
jgi:hypothetical protein